MLLRKLINIVKWVIILLVVISVGKYLINEVFLKSTDITSMITMDKYTLEQTLGITLTPDSNKVGQIYAYTDSKITVESDRKNGISLVYINGVPCGLHIDDYRYNMYGIKIGSTAISMDRKITYPYESNFIVANDFVDGTSTATFYYNETNNDCLVIIANDVTNRIVAVTYYNNLNKSMENLSF